MTDNAGAPTLADGRPAYYPNPTAYATALGFSKQTASNWNRDGLIVRVEDPARPGRQVVDTAATDARRAEEQNPLKRQAPVSASADETAPSGELALDPAAPPAKPSAPADPHKKSAAEAVARTKWIDLRDKEIAQRQKMRELCKTADARALVFQALRLARDTVLRSPMDCCEAANPAEPSVARQAMAEDLTRKLTAVAVQIEAMLAGETAPWDDASDDTPDTGADAEVETETADA